MTYNELAQVLESKNPKTGKLYTLADLNVFPLQKEGTSMLEDGLFADQRLGQCPSGRRDAVHRRVGPRAGSTAVTTSRRARTSSSRTARHFRRVISCGR